MTSNLPERRKLPQITEELGNEENSSKHSDEDVRNRNHFYGPTVRLEEEK